MDLKDKVAIITGASSGIGSATAGNLSDAGMKLVITARREDRLRRLSEELPNTVYLAGDISEPTLPQQLLDTALKEFGRCDVVFSNAGFIDQATVEETDIDRICYMVRVNVEAVYRMAYVALKHFLAQNSGHLINTSSILGTKVRPTVGPYAGTKYAVEALSEALRLELAGSNVKVSCIRPGLVMTELHKRWKVHPTKSMNIPHPVQPEDIARAVRFILEQPDHVLIPNMLVVPAEQTL